MNITCQLISRLLLTGRVKIHGYVCATRRMTKKDDSVNRTITILLRSNIVIYPLTCELHIVCTSRILHVRNQLVVRQHGNNSISSKVFANIGPALEI